MRLRWEDEEATVELPVSMECSKDISSAKIEYVILQFISSALFVAFSLTFTKFMIASYDIDVLLLSLLCICWVHEYVTSIFSFLLTVRTLFSLCLYTRPRSFRKLVVASIISMVLHFTVRSFEIDMPLLHVLLNIIVMVGLVTIIKISRLRLMMCCWLVLRYTYPHFESFTREHSEFQMYFPAIFANRVYSCVSTNILELAMPLAFSLFFTRFSKQSSQTRNVYLMMHLVVYLSVGTYNSIMHIKGTPLEQPLFLTLEGIIAVSFFIALLEGNFRRLVQYRIMI